ncbi:hypothetical protein CLAIMM_13811 [Cladophialophora immunda]|nr:hypothetical protein CLAIMM_13811 [Cladophialophora immunda]
MTSFKIPKPTELTKFYINGEYVEPSTDEVFTVRNPKDDTVVSDHVPVGAQEDVDAAVRHAEAAFKGEWSTFTSAERARCLYRLSDILDEHLGDLLRLDTLTGGHPVSLIPTREKNYIVNGLRRLYLTFEVCVGICPFNSPVATFFHKVAPALVTGNVMIIKPSEKTPLASLALAPLIERAGIPRGVVQVVTGPGKTGELFSRHMRVRKISFTGSIATGKKIQAAAAQSNLKRVTLELGGKGPNVIFEDANLDNAVEWALRAIMARSGQICIAASRLYVQRSIADEFIKRYVEKMREAAKHMGDPFDPDTAYGPLVDKLAFEKVRGMIDRAKAGEAELLVGGNSIGKTGCFIEPTVFVNPRPKAEILTDEVFGPVSVVSTFDTEEEVIQKANDTEYGLMSGVFTRDISRALRFSSKLETGIVGVNCASILNIQVPFGGVKQSGMGREFGMDVLRSFTETKTILINTRAT